MAFMLKIRWDIRAGQEAAFKANQEKLCQVMLDHPGVIAYHAEYPSAGVSEWAEIYATDEAFKAHLGDKRGEAPLGAIIEASAKITCRCFGDPSDQSKTVLAGFGATYEQTGPHAFVLNPRADKDSLI